MTSFIARLGAWVSTRERLRVVAFAVAVLVSMPHALRPPGSASHPGFTNAFVWMAYALTPWSALLPFAVMRARWFVALPACALLAVAVARHEAPLAALGCAIAVAPMLDDWPTSTVLAVGVAVLGLLIAHDLMPTAKLLARASALVVAALACAAVFAPKHRAAVVTALAVVAAIVVRVVQR